ncbi:MAG: hypothetical protein KKE73_12995 [Proteobacteria bacterium]|nr:hypothetical protein [Pseudomonadota bacterium]
MDFKQESSYLVIKNYSDLVCAVFGGYVFAALLLLLVFMWPMGMFAHGMWILILASVFILFCIWFCLRDLVQKRPRVIRFGLTTDIVRGENSYDICSFDEFSHFIMDHDSFIPSQGGCIRQWKEDRNFDIVIFERQILKRSRIVEWVRRGVNATMKKLVRGDSFNCCGFVLKGKCIFNLLIMNEKEYEDLKRLMLDKGVPTYRVDESRRVLKCN